MYALTNINRHYLSYVYIAVWSRIHIETFCTVNINSYVSKELLTWLMKCCLVWSMYWWSLLITCLIRFLALRTLCVFVCYVPYIPALCTFFKRLAHLIYPLSILFLRLKEFPEWICSPSKSFHFPRAIKVTKILTVLRF